MAPSARRALPSLASLALAALLGTGLAQGCGGTPLAPTAGGGAGAGDAAGADGTTNSNGAPGAPPTGAAGASPVLEVPEDIGPPVLSCENSAAGALLIDLPCQMGMAPVSEVDCGLAGYPNEKIRFALVPSLPDAPAGGQIVLGQPTRFVADLLPFQSQPYEFFNLAPQSITGTVVFTKLSLADGTLDGWFPHLDVVLGPTGIGGPGPTVSCRLDKGRFTAVPGGFL